MKIIYLHQYFNTPQMAGGSRSYEMARRFVKWGHEVHIVTSLREGDTPTGGWLESIEDGIYVHWIAVPYSNKMSFRERVAAFIRFAILSSQKAASLGGDVVFATSTPLTIAIPAVYASKVRRIPMVFEVRDLWPEAPIAIGALRHPVAIFLARALERFAYRHAKQIVALSPGMRDGVVKAGASPSRVSVIPNASDLELFSVPSEMGMDFRKQHEWLGTRPLIVYTGALGRVNGAEYLVRIAAEMKTLRADVRFLIVGTGQEEERVRALADKMGVLATNLFMLKSVPKSHMPAILSASTIATSLVINIPELWANSANKFFDALAAGRPIAINYEGWQADLLRQFGAGLVLSPTSPEEAAKTLLGVLNEAGWVEQAGQAARDLAEKRFARDTLALQLIEVIHSAVRLERE